MQRLFRMSVHAAQGVLICLIFLLRGQNGEILFRADNMFTPYVGVRMSPDRYLVKL